MIKESEINELSVSLNGSRIAHCWQAELSIWKNMVANQAVDPTDLNEVVKTTKKEEVDAFSSKIIHGQMKTLLLGNNMYVMTQSLKGGDGPHLPNDLSVVNTYTEVISGSKQVTVVVKNLKAISITIAKGIKVTQVVAANVVPPVKLALNTLEKLDEIQGIQWMKITVGQRKKLLFQQLDLSGLDMWSDRNQVAAQALLAEYHDIFSLEPGRLGCRDLAKHEIRIFNDEPFKERFQRIHPPMLDETHAHLKEMLEVGTIQPSQSPWCNVVVLVHKKDGGLHFCIDFHKLNARTKKDSYPLPQI